MKIVLMAFFSMAWIAVQAFEYRIVSKSENKLPDGVECHLVNVVDCFTVYNDSVKNGAIDISGECERPFPAELVITNNNPDSLIFISLNLIVEPGMMTVDFDKRMVEGGELNRKFSDYEKRIRELWKKDGKQAMQEMKNEFIANRDNAFGEKILIEIGDEGSSPDEWDEALKYIGEETKSLEKIRLLTDRMERLRSSWEGQPYKELSGKGLDGSPVSLSDYVGKGKIVIADFWASWCKGCIIEAKEYLKPLYGQYKDSKDVEIIGIAIDDISEAVKKHGIEWDQIMDCKKVMGIYTIYAFPEIIMFGADGTILHRHLRGEEIERRLVEALQEKKELQRMKINADKCENKLEIW